MSMHNCIIETSPLQQVLILHRSPPRNPHTIIWIKHEVQYNLKNYTSTM